jgi:two-component system sensor kinase FixL
MSIVMPAIVVLQTAIILWLLMRAFGRGISLRFARLKPPTVRANNLECAGMDGSVAPASLLAMANNADPGESPARSRQSHHASREHRRDAAVFSSAADGAQSALRTRHRFTERLRNMTSARPVRPPPCADDARKAAAIAPVSGEHYLREALTLLPIGILMLDERGLMAMVNPQAYRLFGYEREELLGKPVELLVHALGVESNARLWAEPFAIAQSRGCVSLDDLCARRKDGTELRVAIELHPFRFDGANVTLAFAIDRTDRYELRRQREDLAHLTRVSTMGQLASSLAHELNQPLTAILSNVQAAQRFMTADPIDLTELREILNDIVQDDYRASEVIRRIRAVVKKGDLDVIPLNLAGVVRDVVALVHSDAIVRGTRVTLDIDNTLPLVRGDRVQLQQVMLNLLLNAFDAMDDVPPVDRAVSVTLKSTDNGMVLAAVRDRGHGLTADKLDKIFRPFFTSKPQGLGLGLSISRSIIDMHRGRLWAENNNDRGATFYVALPTGDATEEGKSR